MVLGKLRRMILLTTRSETRPSMYVAHSTASARWFVERGESGLLYPGRESKYRFEIAMPACVTNGLPFADQSAVSSPGFNPARRRMPSNSRDSASDAGSGSSGGVVWTTTVDDIACC